MLWDVMFTANVITLHPYPLVPSVAVAVSR